MCSSCLSKECFLTTTGLDGIYGNRASVVTEWPSWICDSSFNKPDPEWDQVDWTPIKYAESEFDIMILTIPWGSLHHLNNVWLPLKPRWPITFLSEQPCVLVTGIVSISRPVSHRDPSSRWHFADLFCRLSSGTWSQSSLAEQKWKI